MTLAPPPLPPIAPPKQWWDRNWKWALPVGCLTALVAFLSIAALLVYLVMSLVMAMMKSTDAYKTALASARANSAVTTVLGTPIVEGWFTTGSVNLEGSTGRIDIAIPVSGPRGSGYVYVVGTKSRNLWTYTTLVAQIDGSNQRIDLAPPAP